MEKIDEFLFGILNQNSCDNPARNEAAKFLLKSEKVVGTFLKDKDRAELEFPPLNSYYRRIIHRLGRRYNLVHRVEATNIFNENSTLRKIYLTKPVANGSEYLLEDLPILKCSDWLPLTKEKVEKSDLIVFNEKKKSSKKEDKRTDKSVEKVSSENPAEKPKIKILKRTTPSQPNSPQSTEPLTVTQMVETLSLEELEAKYQAARERIFEGFTEESVNENSGVLGANNTIESEPVHITNVSDTCKRVDTSDSCEAVKTNETPQPESHSQSSSQLNPDAVPFSLPLPSIEINHIYTVTSPTNSPITREDLQELIKSLVPRLALIKTRQIPTNFAFLLTTTEEFAVVNTKLSITKWEPEFYLDN